MFILHWRNYVASNGKFSKIVKLALSFVMCLVKLKASIAKGKYMADLTRKCVLSSSNPQKPFVICKAASFNNKDCV